jgi:hypothetical protein
MGILRRFFGTDEFALSITSVPVSQTREYTRFSDVMKDVVDVRVYQGIHFRFADEADRKQGTQVARWVFKRYLRPVHKDDDKDDGKDDEKEDDKDNDKKR